MCIKGTISLKWNSYETLLIIDRALFEFHILTKYKRKMIWNHWLKIETHSNKTLWQIIKMVWWLKLRYIQTYLKWERISYSQSNNFSKTFMKFQRISIESSINRKGNLKMSLRTYRRSMRTHLKLKKNFKKQLLLKKIKTSVCLLSFQFCV